ncbi:MAG: UDP-N-acetylmuramoyl-L-alanine--D-glutamate ligase [Nannocystis sp.]|nr:UDP-N-acetylmuramoyl-L-alanine--D-glutamate ligase [Nannocystis sp.]MBA3549845.1 UDP-N-acetylmuramoyl-L-alanine--D-glutamate ligase [Nannocystis sp.]
MLPHPWHGTVLVIGAGASGLAAAALLLPLAAEVRVYDRRPAAELPPGAVPFLGADTIPDAAVLGIDLMVLSPGVPPAPFLAARERLAPAAAVHGEMSLSLAVADELWGHLPTVLITGTNGKSTVTALTGALLTAAGRRPFVGGNLGVPLAAAVLAGHLDPAAAPDCLVLECSSFQLETFPGDPEEARHVDVAMILNLTPDHLDRYPSIEDYAATKARALAGIAHHSPGVAHHSPGSPGVAHHSPGSPSVAHHSPGSPSVALFDAGDPWTPFFARHVHADHVITIDADSSSAQSASIRGPGPGDTLVLPDGETFPRAALRLAGRHNSKNALFALTAARHLGASPSACLAGLQSFVGLPHRMVHVRDLDDIAYYDDSKATNVASVLASLGGFERSFVLIAGGRAKGDDLAPLRDLLAAQGRALVAIGESSEQFFALAGGLVPAARASDMAEAVAHARRLARPGDAVVLSPACASYDWFKNYGERGDVFAACVDALE